MRQSIPNISRKKQDLCTERSGSLQNAIDLTHSSKSTVLSVLDSTEKEHLDVKKSERKEFLEEMQSVAEEISYDAIIEEANRMLSERGSSRRELRAQSVKRNMSTATTFEEECDVPGQARASTRESFSALCNATEFPAVTAGERSAIHQRSKRSASRASQSLSPMHQISRQLSH